MGIPCRIVGPYSFLCESFYWPLTHFLLPGIVYRITRSYWVTLSFMVIWEAVEAFTSGATGGSLDFFAAIDPATGRVTAAAAETILDSFGDLLMGSLGVFTEHFRLKLTDTPRMLPRKLGWHGESALWLKYAFQLLVYGAPTAALQLYLLGGGPLVPSLGWLLMLLVWPPWAYLCGRWNWTDPVWTYHEVTVTANAKDPRDTRQGLAYLYLPTAWRWKEGHQTRTHLSLALYYLLFVGANGYHFFDSMWFQVFTLGAVTGLLLWIATAFYPPSLPPSSHPCFDSYALIF